ncbi:MAG: Acg family FMN-binding oxidoreductase [Candidatus Hodarchaeota archaeon]
MDEGLELWIKAEEGVLEEGIRSLVDYAVLAPSLYNSQPWKFRVRLEEERDEGLIQLFFDRGRCLPFVDPSFKEIYISLGAALENLIVAAEYFKYTPYVKFLPEGEKSDLVANVELMRAVGKEDEALFKAISERRTNRGPYESRAVSDEVIEKLESIVPEGLNLQFVSEDKVKDFIASAVKNALKYQFRNKKLRNEIYSWMRFSREEAVTCRDGISLEAWNISGLKAKIFPVVMKPKAVDLFHSDSLFVRSIGKLIEKTPLIGLLSADVNTRKTQIIGGRTYEQLSLVAINLGISFHPLNAAIEVETYKEQVRDAYMLLDEEPFVLFRIGYGDLAPQSMRKFPEFME